MDEAVLRIVLQDSGGDASTAPQSAAPSSPPQPKPHRPPKPTTATDAFDPVAEAQKRLDADVRRTAADAEYAKLVPPKPTFDPAEVAKERLEADKRREAVEAEYAKLVPVKPPFDPVEIARERLEKDKQRQQIEAEYAKLIPPEPPFDPVKEAQKRLDTDKKRAEIDAEYAKLKPTPPFDPQAEARKRREGERHKAQIDDAYKQQYGGPNQKTPLDNILKIADSLRGTIGGLAGTVVGAALDAVVGFRKVQVETAKKKHERDLLSEVPVGKGGTATTTASKGIGAGSSGVATGAKVAKGTAAVGDATEGIAAAAGPIAIAAIVTAAVLAIDQAVKGAIKGAISTVGGIASTIASPSSDPSEPIAKLGDAASKAGEKIPILGIAAVVAGESLKALSSVMQALDKTAERYAEFSPEIAQAQAIAEIRQTMGDFRRAQQVGPEMAKYIMARSDLQQRFEDIKVRLMTKLIPVVTRILEIVEVAVAAGEGVGEAIAILAAPLVAIASAIDQILGIQRDARIQDVEDPTDIILGKDKNGNWKHPFGQVGEIPGG